MALQCNIFFFLADSAGCSYLCDAFIGQPLLILHMELAGSLTVLVYNNGNKKVG